MGRWGSVVRFVLSIRKFVVKTMMTSTFITPSYFLMRVNTSTLFPGSSRLHVALSALLNYFVASKKSADYKLESISVSEIGGRISLQIRSFVG